MSAYNIVQKIAEEAKKRQARGEDDSYQLEIVLRSGRTIICAPWESNSYFLKVTEEVRTDDATGVTVEERVSYLSYEAIEQVTPLWP